MTDAPCYLCGGTEHDRIQTKFRYPTDKIARKCRACGLVSLHPLMTPEEERKFYAEEYARVYAAEKGTEPGGLFEARIKDARMYYDWFKHHLKPSSSCLEVGCASGYFLDILRKHCHGVAGIETFPSLRQECAERGIPMHDGLWAIPDGSFDNTFAIFLLEHLGDPILFLKECLRVTRKGGKVFVVVPNIDEALLSAYGLQSYRDFCFTPAHQFYFSPTTLAKIVQKTGMGGMLFGRQRYGLSNHLRWIRDGKPGGTEEYGRICNGAVDAVYRLKLSCESMCDTLVAVAEVS